MAIALPALAGNQPDFATQFGLGMNQGQAYRTNEVALKDAEDARRKNGLTFLVNASTKINTPQDFEQFKKVALTIDPEAADAINTATFEDLPRIRAGLTSLADQQKMEIAGATADANIGLIGAKTNYVGAQTQDIGVDNRRADWKTGAEVANIGNEMGNRDAGTALAYEKARRSGYGQAPAGTIVGDNGVGAPILGPDGQPVADPTATSADILTAEDLDYAAQKYRLTNTLPPLGSGKAAAATRQRIIHRAREQAQAEGKTGADDVDLSQKTAQKRAARLNLVNTGPGKAGGIVRAANAGIDHTTTLEGAIDALNNGDTPLVNKFANMIATQMGSPNVVTFDAMRQVVGSELSKLVVGGVGGEGERQQLIDTFNSSNTPEQLRSVITGMKKLAAGQVNALRYEYKSLDLEDEFDAGLAPSTKKELGIGSTSGDEIDDLISKYSQ